MLNDEIGQRALFLLTMALASTRAAPTPSQGSRAEKRGVPRGVLIAGGVGLGAVLLTLFAVRARAQARDEALARGETPPSDDGWLGTLTNLLAPADDPLGGAGGGRPGGDGSGDGRDGAGGGDGDGGGSGDGGGDGGTRSPDEEDEYTCPPGYTLDASRLVCVPSTSNNGGPQPPTCPPGYAWDGVTCRLVGPGGGGDDTTTTSTPGTDGGDGGFDWTALFGAGIAGAGLTLALKDKIKGKGGDDGRTPPREEPETSRKSPEEPREEPRRPAADEAPRGEPERPRTGGEAEARPPGETPEVRAARTRTASDPFAPRGLREEEPARRNVASERAPRGGAVETTRAGSGGALQLEVRPAAEPAPPTERLKPLAEPSSHVSGPRPAGEVPPASRSTNVLDLRAAEAARLTPAAAETSLLAKAGKAARGVGKAGALAGDVLFLYEGGVTVAQGAPSIAQGAKAILNGGKDLTPEDAQRIRDDTAKTAKEGSSLLSFGFAEIDLADRDKTQRSPLKIGLPDWLGVSDSETGNFVRANVGLGPNKLLGFIPTPTVSLEENRLPKPEQFAQGARTLLKSDNLAQKAVGVAVAPAAIVAEATTIPTSQFLSGAQNLAGIAGQKAAEARDFAGQKVGEAGAAVSNAAAAGYEKTGLGAVGGFFTDRGLNPFARPAPAAPPPVTPAFASQEKNDRDLAVFYAKQGKALPSNLAKYESEVASYRPATTIPSSIRAPDPAPASTKPAVYGPPAPSAPTTFLTELQRRILAGTEPRSATPAAPQPTLGPNNSAASPPHAPTYEQRRLVGDIPATPPPAAPTAPTPKPPAPPKTAEDRLEERLRKRLALL